MDVKDGIKDFYGKQLQSSNDLEATAVISCNKQRENLPDFVKEALNDVHEDITGRTYGCATQYPEALFGTNVLDLGSGCGRDCFVLSKLVGKDGQVVGLDMTDELLSLARNHIEYHTTKFGYSQPNVSFVKGYLEKMDEAGLQDDFFDIIVSNCVICLCRDKNAVLKEAARVLKDGGEIYFSDMYREGDLPKEVLQDEQMWCEGLVGSLTYLQLSDIAKLLGFTTPRVVKARPLPVVNETMKSKLKNVRYAAVTYRLNKKPTNFEQYSSSEVMYKGGIKGCEDAVRFDHLLTFKKGEKQVVDQEMTAILSTSRFAPYFDISSTKDKVEVSPAVDPFTLFSCCNKS